MLEEIRQKLKQLSAVLMIVFVTLFFNIQFGLRLRLQQMKLI
jgi:hypothetical protein